MTSGTRHLRSLTSLRFLAAALVVLYHCGVQSSPDLTQPYAALRFGFLGVTFFFVLSGFVLVWSARDGDTVGGFYRRRFARVWPLHALTLLLAVLLVALSLVERRWEGPPWAFALNLALLQAWSGDVDVIYGFNGVSWSLSAEAVFYALFPLLLLRARRHGPVATIAGGVALLLAGGVLAEATGAMWVAVSLPACRVGEFVVGMGLALLVHRGVPRVPPLLAMGVLAGSYAALVVGNRLSAGRLADHAWVAALVVLPGVALVLVAYATRDLAGGGGWLTRPVAVRLGAWSFALYLVHELVLRVAHPVLVDRLWVAPVAVVVALALAGALHEWVEQPLERRLRGGTGRPAQPAPVTR